MGAEQRNQSIRTIAATAAFLALAAVVYGTLLPFEFRFVSFADARATYLAHLGQSLDMSAGLDREQWVANLFLFLPLGFFWALWFALDRRSPLARFAVVVCVAILALFVTATVEFLQVGIPGRAPSFVDMSGNLVGGVIGAVAGGFWSVGRWSALVDGLVGRERVNPRKALMAYTLLYVLASLFPFDFPLSIGELVETFTAESWGGWVAQGYCSDTARCVVATLLKPVLALPVGLWIGMSLGEGRLRAMVLAVACAFAIEVLQLLLASGVAEGRSAGARGLGMAVGASLVGVGSFHAMCNSLQRWGRVLALIAFPVYVVSVVGILVGTSGYHWEVNRALTQLESLQFLPFYYHYQVGETVAVRSMLSQAIAYAPTGLLVWLATQGRPCRGKRGGGAWWAVGGALALAAVVEGLRLLAEGERPDPTTLVIAPAVAVIVYALLCLLIAPTVAAAPDAARASGSASNDDAGAETTPDSSQSVTRGEHPAWVLRGCGVLLWGGLLVTGAMWPVWAPWMVAGLVGYGFILYFWPSAAVFIIPAAVPFLDFSLLTGLEAFDEFDLLVLASIAGLLLFARRTQTSSGLPPLTASLFGLFALSLLVSSVIGWFEMSGLAAKGVTAYLSEYNMLRQVKGFALALGFFLVLPQTGFDGPTLLKRYFVPGTVLGLFFVLTIVAWERAAYPGPFNFQSTYRPTALFTDMQVGGPTIETYLVLTLPFLVWWCWLRPTVVRALMALVLLVGGVHALWITYSRGGYLGFVVAVAVITLLAAFTLAWRGRRWRVWLLAGLGGLVLVIAGAGTTGLWVQSQDGFAGQRLGQIEQDLERRVDHWQESMELRKSEPVARILGHGPGAFPQAFFLSSPPNSRPGNFAFREEDGKSVLALGPGDPVYMNQRVPRVSGGVYELRARGQSDRDTNLRVFLCQKHILHSIECVSRTLRFPGDGDAVQTRRIDLPTQELVQGDTFPRRHHVISVRNMSRAGVIRLEKLELISDTGEAVLRNTDFSAGGTYWYFTTDELKPWRVENQALEILFDRGWVGLAVFVALVASALGLLAARAVREDFGYAVAAGSVCGVLTVGIFSTVFFSPRLAFLFYLLLLLSLSTTRRRRKATH